MNADQVKRLSQGLRKVTKLYNAAIVDLVKDVELTKPQMITLAQIYKGPKTIGEITEATFLSYSTVSGIIDRLERDGWVERVRDTNDRRVTWIKKTEKAEQFKTIFLTFEQKLFDSVFQSLNDEEIEGIQHSIDTLIELFQIQLQNHSNDENPSH